MRLLVYTMVVLFFSMVFVTCSLEDPQSIIDASELISLEYDESTLLYANGEDQIELIAKLAINPDTSKDIIFKTDFGTFASTLGTLSNNDKELTFNTSSGASVFLIADTMPRENVTVTVTVEGYTLFATFQYLEIDNFIKLVLTGDVNDFSANGSTPINLQAKLDSRVSLGSNITFTTQAGSFVNLGGTVSPDGKTYTVAAQSRSIDATVITSSTPANDVAISAQINNYSNHVLVNFINQIPGISDVLDLSIKSSNSIPANNFSEAELFVTFGPEADLTNQVVLKTEQGSFLNIGGGTLSADSKEISFSINADTIFAFLRSDRIPNPNVVVSASIGEISDFESIAFTNAYPTIGTLERNKFMVAINGNDAAQLTAKFLRNGAEEVSDNLLVAFDAVPIDTSMAIAKITPSFVNTVNQEAITSIVSENGVKGKVRVRAWIVDAPLFTDTLFNMIEFVD